MNILETDIKGVLILEPKVFKDNRGYFLETYRKAHFEEYGLSVDFLQDNSSRSKKRTIRGLHFQSVNAAQAKLVMVGQGRIRDVAVDLRRTSPTFGQSVAVELSEENHRQLYIPEGFAHGFSVLSDEAVIHYKCSNYYNAKEERGVRWDDPDLCIEWGVDQPLLSEKDQELPLLENLKPDDLFP